MNDEEILHLKDALSRAKAQARSSELEAEYHASCCQLAQIMHVQHLREVEALEKELAHRIRELELSEPRGMFGWIR